MSRDLFLDPDASGVVKKSIFVFCNLLILDWLSPHPLPVFLGGLSLSHFPTPPLLSKSHLCHPDTATGIIPYSSCSETLLHSYQLEDAQTVILHPKCLSSTLTEITALQLMATGDR